MKKVFIISLLLTFCFSACDKLKEERDKFLKNSSGPLISSGPSSGSFGPTSFNGQTQKLICPEPATDVKVKLFGELGSWCGVKSSGGAVVLRRYHKSDQLKTEIKVDGQRYHYRSFSAKGSLEEEGKYQDERKQGVWTSYYPDGAEKGRVTWHKGKKHGPSEEFGPKGQRTAHYSYAADKLHGAYFRYYPDGTTAEQGIYEQGQKNGKWSSFDPSGKLLATTTFTQGRTPSSPLLSQVPFSGGDTLGKTPAPELEKPGKDGQQSKSTWETVKKSPGWEPM